MTPVSEDGAYVKDIGTVLSLGAAASDNGQRKCTTQATQSGKLGLGEIPTGIARIMYTFGESLAMPIFVFHEESELP